MLRLGFSLLSKRRRRSLDRLPYISIPVTLARHIEPNQVRAKVTGAPTNATVPAVWFSVKVNGIARNQTTAKTAPATALAADIFWAGVLKIAFRLATVESNWLVRLVTSRSIKWTSELEQHLVRGDAVPFTTLSVVSGLYRPFTAKHCYYAPIVTHRRYQMPQIFPHQGTQQNKVICFTAMGSNKPFHALATDKLPDLHLAGDTQCLPLYRYTAESERESNITQWGLRKFREHYGDDSIGAEDVFAYTYAMLHDPAYRQRYELDLRRDFPRVYFQEDFPWWAQQGRALLDLHLGFETAEPWLLERFDKDGVTPTRVILRADKEHGVIALDE